MEQNEIDVSLIIPCYNENQFMERNLAILIDTLSVTRYKYEIILIDDCSKDNTRELGMAAAQKYENIIWKEHQANMGRGRTVTDGIEISRGRIVGYIDLDLEVDASYIIPALIEIEKGADLVVGWRLEHLRLNVLPLKKRPLAIGYWIIRFVLSKGYNLVLKLMLNVEFNDTECGFKFFNKERILPVLKKLKANHWFWDTEILVMAHLAGLKIVEIPCLYIKNLEKKSTVKIFKDTKDYLYQIYNFRKELRAKKH